MAVSNPSPVPEPMPHADQQRVLKRLTNVIASHPWPLAMLVLGVGLPLYIFGELAEDVWRKHGFSWDEPIQWAVHSLAHPRVDRRVMFITWFGAPQIVALLMTAVSSLMFLRKHAGHAVYFVFSVGGALATDLTVKRFFRRSRPQLWTSPAPETDYSFPSGHAMGTIAFATTLIVLAWSTAWRWVSILLGSVYVLTIALTRVYLGVHYPSDILGAWMAGLAWVFGMRLVWKNWVIHFYRGDNQKVIPESKQP